MSVRPRSGEQVPSLIGQIARASNAKGTPAMWVRDPLDGLWHDEDFAGWYPREGRPGLSPAEPATIRVLQFLLGLSDRQAVEAVRAALEGVARTAGRLLVDLVDAEWGAAAPSRRQLVHAVGAVGGHPGLVVGRGAEAPVGDDRAWWVLTSAARKRGVHADPFEPPRRPATCDNNNP
ncbi:hypothetical protein [Streptomyces sp. 769]|uniref:hypothetical protein n=1 Tax=Streptomyces sp. 769 TaxID=1262452 RepID=UPI00193A7629|nr:hypothetical protein [Streptomyces sp. 769]